MDRTAVLALLHALNLPALGMDYCVIGSAALMLSGLALDTCDDVDILTSRANADRLAAHWQRHLSQRAHTNGHRLFRSHYYRFEFPQGAVEVMGDLEIEREGSWHPVHVQETITHDGFIIPSLREQQRLLRLFGRPKDLAKLALF